MESNTKQIALVGILMLVVVTIIAVASIGIDTPKKVTTKEYTSFNSVDEIREFLESNYEENYYYGGVGLARNTMMVEEAAVASDSAAGGEGAVPAPQIQDKAASDYSETNIQVKGVDEPDIVKNDGEYIYTQVNNQVVIVKVYPAENMEVVSEITFEGDEYPSNILLKDDQLIVFTSKYEYIQTGIGCNDFFTGGEMVSIRPIPCGGYSKTTTHVYVYDITDRSDPKLETDYEIDGDFVQSRMIDEYVYLITNKNINLEAFSLPYYAVNGEVFEQPANKVSYAGSQSGRYVFSTVTAIDLTDGETNAETYLIDYTTTLYASENNIYLTSRKQIDPEYYVERLVREVYIKTVPSLENELDEILESEESYGEKAQKIEKELQAHFRELSEAEIVELSKEFEKNLEAFSREISKEREKTVVHKIAIDELDIKYQTFGEVPGTPLNQFAMDEYDGHFRITTTTGNWRDTSLNHLYILDEDLDIVGSVENLAEGERIYSTRFIGDKAYMVTFRQVDPLYVIDTSNPKEPEVLGYLKITGFSSYLHPYDENHLLGIGQEATEQGRTQGVKISLFDISDFSNPREVSKYVVNEGEYSYSEALYDHKAVLFDKSQDLLVIPMSYNTRTPTVAENERVFYDYENWQGAFVFNIEPMDIELKGKIAHELEEDEYYQEYGYIRRSLYMDESLYTVSDHKIKANLLSDLTEQNEIELPYKGYYYGIYDSRGVADTPEAMPELIE